MSSKVSRTIKKCRVCGSKKIAPIISLGNIYVSNFVDSRKNLKGKQYGKQPLDLVMCDGCGLVQLRHTYAPELMYRDYWYRSGVNQTMPAALSDIVQKAEKIVKPKSGNFVID